LLFIRSGFISTYYTKTPDERAAAALRPHALGTEDGQRWAGIKQEEVMIDWLHDCYFAAVAGDAPSFEAWPSHESYMLHEYILAMWGMPLGEMFDLEALSQICKEKGRWTFFVTSSPSNCEVTIPFLYLDSLIFLDFAAMCFPSYVSSSSGLHLRTKAHTNLL
jgi:hypothetical protein